MKSIFLILISFVTNLCYADISAANLKALANTGRWADYKPDNFELVKKMGSTAFFWSSEAEAEQIEDRYLIARDPFLQFKPSALVEAQRKTKTDVMIYKKYYSFDKKGRRELGLTANPSRKNFITLGCSFTLGTGLSDNETFPYFFSQEFSRGYNVYNLGIYGAGANDILDDLKSFKRFEDIPKTGGIVVYTAIFDHIERSLCTLNCYRATYKGWVLKKSNYEFDSQTQTMINKGSFANSRPIMGPLFNALASFSLFDKINIPPELTEEQIERYVLMLVEIKKIVQLKLNSDFYFTFYPGYYEHWDRIKKSLEKHQVKYLDLSEINFRNITDGRDSIILDGHPTSLSSYLYAYVLASSLPDFK